MNARHARLLATLSRKLDAELECARTRLAQLRVQEQTQDEAVRGLRARCAEEERGAALLSGAPLDAARHGQVLRHLVRLRAAIARGEQAGQDMRERVLQAVAACAAQERQLACARELHEAIERLQAAQAQRRAAAEADRAWLARRAQAAPSAGAGE